MRDYAKVLPAFWTGETGRRICSLGHEAITTALYLITSPHANMIGVYYLPIVYICHHTGSSFEGASKALRSLREVGFCHYDEAREEVFVVEMARIQVGETLSPKDNRHKALIKELETKRKSTFFNEFLDRYVDAYALGSVPRQGAAPKPHASPFEAPCDSLRSQEQDQEQDQDQECETRAGARGHTHAEPSSPEDLPAETRERIAEVQRVFRERVAASEADARVEQQLAALVEAEFRERYESARPEAGPWETPPRFWQAFLEIGRLAAGKPCGVEDALDRALGAWFAADFPRTIDYRPTTLAEQFNQWFAPPGKTAGPKGPKEELIERRARLEDELNDARANGQTAEEERLAQEIAKVNARIRSANSEAA